jgi:hypothetical protein
MQQLRRQVHLILTMTSNLLSLERLTANTFDLITNADKQSRDSSLACVLQQMAPTPLSISV